MTEINEQVRHTEAEGIKDGEKVERLRRRRAGKRGRERGEWRGTGRRPERGKESECGGKRVSVCGGELERGSGEEEKEVGRGWRLKRREIVAGFYESAAADMRIFQRFEHFQYGRY